LYLARLASVNAPESSVASTVKLCSWPSFWIAAMPSGMESWRKPVVLEKTRALNDGSAAGAAVSACVAVGVTAMVVATAAARVATTSGLPSRAVLRNRDLNADALLVRDIY
jgi:hypothetical protein